MPWGKYYNASFGSDIFRQGTYPDARRRRRSVARPSSTTVSLSTKKGILSQKPAWNDRRVHRQSFSEPSKNVSGPSKLKLKPLEEYEAYVTQRQAEIRIRLSEFRATTCASLGRHTRCPTVSAAAVDDSEQRATRQLDKLGEEDSKSPTDVARRTDVRVEPPVPEFADRTTSVVQLRCPTISEEELMRLIEKGVASWQQRRVPPSEAEETVLRDVDAPYAKSRVHTQATNETHASSLASLADDAFEYTSEANRGPLRHTATLIPTTAPNTRISEAARPLWSRFQPTGNEYSVYKPSDLSLGQLRPYEEGENWQTADCYH